MSTRKRSARRAADRTSEKLTRDLERLALLSPGGAPERPIVIETAIAIDNRARATPCPVCGGDVDLEDHTAETLKGVRLRLAHVRCRLCKRARVIYFEVKGSLLS